MLMVGKYAIAAKDLKRTKKLGEGGFGFNLGNIGQDLCLSNVMVEESRISPYEDFPATLDPEFVFPADACRGVMILSQLEVPVADAG